MYKYVLKLFKVNNVIIQMLSLSFKTIEIKMHNR